MKNFGHDIIDFEQYLIKVKTQILPKKIESAIRSLKRYEKGFRDCSILETLETLRAYKWAAFDVEDYSQILNDPELLRIYAIRSLQAKINETIQLLIDAGKIKCFDSFLGSYDWDSIKSEFADYNIRIDEIEMLNQFRNLDDIRAFLYQRAGLSFISMDQMKMYQSQYFEKKIAPDEYYTLLLKAGIEEVYEKDHLLRLREIRTDYAAIMDVYFHPENCPEVVSNHTKKKTLFDFFQ